MVKSTYNRRYRRRTSAAPEGNFFKKESGEQSFFSEPATAPFFSPAPAATGAVQRKSDEGEDKKLHRMHDKKEEEMLLRKCDKCEEEDKEAHRKPDEQKEEGKLHRKENSNSSGGNAAMGYISSINGKGNPLSASASDFFSSRMGQDFSDVAIHTGAEAAESAKSINAKAYTVGNNIVFNQGQYQPDTHEGKKLLAHELAHVVQQQEGVVSRDVDEAGCDDAQLNLEGSTDAVYNKGAGKTIGEKKKASKDCDGCEDDCVSYSGTLSVPYDVQTTVTLPDVPEDLRPCQKKRVAAVIKNKLAPHEQKHVAAFKTFNGTAFLPIKYTGCEGGYNSYLEDLAQNEFDRRKDIADKKSAKLDPYSEDVDMCCKDTDTVSKSPAPAKK